MTDDAIETVAERMRERLLRRQPDADYSTADFRTMAITLVHRAALIGLTPFDLAGLADGTRVVVPMPTEDEEGVRQAARVIYEAMFSPGEEDNEGCVMPPFDEAEREEYGGHDMAMGAARVVRAMALAARPGAKEPTDAA